MKKMILLFAVAAFQVGTFDAISANPLRVNLVCIPNPSRFVTDQVKQRKIDRVLEAALPGDGVLVIVVARPRDVWSGIGTTAVEKARVIKNATDVIREASSSPVYTEDFGKRVAAIKRSLLSEYAGSVIFNEITLGTPSASFSPTSGYTAEVILPPPIYEPREREIPTDKPSTPKYLPQVDDTIANAIFCTLAVGSLATIGFFGWRRRQQKRNAALEEIDQKEQQLVEEEHNVPRRFLATKTKVFLNVFLVGLLFGYPLQVALCQSRELRSGPETYQSPATAVQASAVDNVQSKKRATYNIVDVSGSTTLARKQAKADIRTRLALGDSHQYLLLFGDSLLWLGEVTSLSQLDTLDGIKAHRKTRLVQPVLAVATIADTLFRRGVKVNFVLYSDFIADDYGNATLELTGNKGGNANSTLKVTAPTTTKQYSEASGDETIFLLISAAVVITLVILLFLLRRRQVTVVPRRVLLTSPDGRMKEISGRELLTRTVRLGTQLDADIRVENGHGLSAYIDRRQKVPSMTIEHSSPDGSTKIELMY